MVLNDQEIGGGGTNFNSNLHLNTSQRNILGEGGQLLGLCSSLLYTSLTERPDTWNVRKAAVLVHVLVLA